MTTTNGRPVPVQTPDTSFFWQGAETGELRIQQCADCQTLRHPPGPMCPSCHSFNWTYIVSSGRGTIYSYVVHHYPDVPGQTSPFAILLVELDEGTRLITNLAAGFAPDSIEVGMRVELVCESDGAGSMTLPLFKPHADSNEA